MFGTFGRWGVVLFLLLVTALGPAGCVPVPPSQERVPVTEAPAMTLPAATNASTASATAPAPALDLPGSFRYAADIRPAGAPEAATTHIAGEYRDGDWSQISRSDEASVSPGDQVEESMVVGGSSYTRPAGETTWTRWPGLGYDASYGLVSPFTVLRLYPLADERTDRALSLIVGVPEPTFRIQTSISAETIRQVLSAGISAIAADEQTRSVLEAQVAPLAVPQTITYWVGEDGLVYQAAATLLAADETGQPAPWVEATWRYWGYGDGGITLQAPAEFQEASTSGPAGQAEPEAVAETTASASGNLVVRVFSAPGVPAEHLAVIVYPAGEADQPVNWRTDATAEFSLPPGSYDILVQMDYAQERLNAVSVAAGETTTREVVFDFGVLEVAAVRDGAPVPVEVVVYPAGDRENWVDWRSDNPAIIPLRAGEYDVEIAVPGEDGVRRTLQGLVVRPGETTKETVEVSP